MALSAKDILHIITNFPPEEAAAIIAEPAESTIRRRLEKEKRPFPIISRGKRRYVSSDGRRFGALYSEEEQRDSDSRYWRAGKAVREACQPMTVAEGGIVKRIYEVHGWHQEQNQTKWTAELGDALTNEELDKHYPDYPYRIGDDCPTQGGGAYRPGYY